MRLTRFSLRLIAGLGVAGCAAQVASVQPADRAPAFAPRQAEDPYFAAGAARIAAMQNHERARNLILFVGDGMGPTTVTAARIYAGQRSGVDGESHQLSIDNFPHTALARTYSHDFQISDSASTATALTAGVKTRTGVLGLTADVIRGDCAGSRGRETDSLFALGEAAGMATGLVSTARLTHATPAAAYANAADRGWENDAATPAGCVDIARQLVEWSAGDGLEIALGGGREHFLPSDIADPEDHGGRGARTDGRNLAQEWIDHSPAHVFIYDAAGLAAADIAGGARVLGLFAASHMAYEDQRDADTAGEPSLAEMTQAAIARLAMAENGYLLLVEAGRIDHAHHAGQAGRALSETVALDDAVRAALAMTDREDTLIVVTADHSHTITMAGYAARGTDILGLSRDAEGEPNHAADGLPYTTLAYANGPGSVYRPVAQARRPDLSAVDTTGLDFQQPSLVPGYSETHGGEDVVVYAWGPSDHLFAGTWEQNVVFHALARALGLYWE